MEKSVLFPAGEFVLEGLLSIPTVPPSIGVVVCHPHPLYGGEMRNTVVSALVAAFQLERMATLRFNFRGVGASTGAHGEGIAEIEDVTAAVTCLLDGCNLSTVVVAGYSFGSIVGMAAGARDPRVHQLIGVALPVARRDATFLTSCEKPKLLVSGDRDDVSPVGALDSLVAQCAEPKSLAIIKGADHFFGGYEHEIARPAVDFIQRHAIRPAT